MRTGQRVAVIGMAVSGSLAALKILAGTMGHSRAVVADGFESAADVLASGFVWLGLTLAAKPPDEEHPYGHGRLETLAGFVVGMMLAAAGAVIAWRSLGSLGQVREPPQAYVVWPLAISAVAKAALAAYKFRFGKRLESAALTADAWNDLMDVLSALTALVCVGLALLDPSRFLAADHYGGFLVGLFVIVTGARVAHDAAVQLIDTMPEEARIIEVRRVAREVPGVRGVEKCFARKTGLTYHVDLHLEVDPEITVRESHGIASEVRNHVRQSLGWVADVLVHVEPAP
jgi:cation diffusion facilitator family transporter